MPLHPIIDTAWDNAGILWTNGAMPPCVSVVQREMDKMTTYYVKQPNKPVYRAFGNPTRGKVTESKVTVKVDLAARSIGN